MYIQDANGIIIQWENQRKGAVAVEVQNGSHWSDLWVHSFGMICIRINNPGTGASKELINPPLERTCWFLRCTRI